MSKRIRETTGSAKALIKKPRSSPDGEEGASAADGTIETIGDDKEAEYGIIEEISMNNFMCHDHLEFKFGSHINFIVGRNGSGKSAVLTALVVGLGGKATSTNRGNSIKNFIKYGKHKATVTVKLRNRGTDAFKRNEYGDSIIVERFFSTDGGGGYKIKSENGDVITTKREDLVQILDQFNIQVENPVAVLNQETSRNFLNAGKPVNYYKFFLKATQLEQMQHDYQLAHEYRRETMGIVESKTKLLPQLEAEVLKLEHKYKAIMSLDDLRDKVSSLKNELAWAFVYEKEKTLEPMVKALKQEELRTPKFDQRIEQAKEKLESALKERDEIHQRLQAMSDDVRTIQPLHDKAKVQLQETKKVHRAAVMDCRRVEHDIKNAMKDKTQMMERIEEIRAKAQNNKHEQAAREQKIAGLVDKCSALKSQRATKEMELDRFRASVARNRDDERQFKNEERELQHLINESQKRAKDMDNSRNNNLARYGRWIPALLTKIEEAYKKGRFHEKPRGPIGANIHLRDPQWALAIETAIKGTLRAFCCHDHHDEKVLEQLMRDANIPPGQKPDTVVSKFLPQMHDISRFKVRCDYPTILDMLEIRDPVVANLLIDKCRIENVILIRDNEEARVVMERRPPQHVNVAFTPNGDQIIHSPTYKIYSCNSQRSEYLSVNVESDLRMMNEQVDTYRRQLAACQQRLAQKGKEIQSNQAEETRVQRMLMQNAEAINKLQYEIDELQNVDEPAPADIIVLEKEIEKYDENIDVLEKTMKTKKNAADQARIETEAAEQEMKEIDKKMVEMSENVDPLKERLADVEFKIENCRKEKKHYDVKMKEHRQNIKIKNDQIIAFQLDIEEKIKMASEICERISVRRAPRNLESEIIQIQKQIEMEERTQGDKKRIVEEYHSKSEAYKEIRAEVKGFTHFLERLKSTMQARQMAFADMRRMIAMRTRYIFITMLSSRHYSGKLIFDHLKESLVVSVQPTVDKSGQGSKDVKALSGGERSFSTVCFILSLWQAMESPFRCLDEFDVFMDMVNRRISMDMMMQAAYHQRQRQFIFLTPLDICSMDLQKTVCIYEMPDPEREKATVQEPTNENDENE